MGKEVRLTLSELRVFLPQNVYRNKRGDLQKLERDLEAVRTELLDGSIKVSIEEIMRRMTLPDGDLVEGAGEELGGDSDDELRESESNSALLSIISGKRGELLSLEKKLSQRLLAANRCLENEAAAEANIVVCTTTFGNGGALSELVRSGHFGLLCLDEAGFSDDANVLPLLSKANRLILGKQTHDRTNSSNYHWSVVHVQLVIICNCHQWYSVTLLVVLATTLVCWSAFLRWCPILCTCSPRNIAPTMSYPIGALLTSMVAKSLPMSL